MISQQELNKEVTRLLQAGKQVAAIKFYREKTGVSLKNAKDYVDSLAKQQNLTPIIPDSKPPSFWTKIFIGFIILNVLLFIFEMISSSIIDSVEYMDSLFGMSEWEVDEFQATLAQEVYLIPIIIALKLFLFVFLLMKSMGIQLRLKTYVIFITVLALIACPISYFLKIDKNRFKNQQTMTVIFDELKDKRAFKDKEIVVSDLGFYVGNIDRQTSIYIVATFNEDRYTYRPYNLIMNWSKDNHQHTYSATESIALDQLNVEKIVPKIFVTSGNLITNKELSYRYKGVGRVSLIHTIVNGKRDWYWRSVIEQRGNRSLSSEYVMFDLNGNLVEIPEVFQD